MKIIQSFLPLGPARPGIALDSILALVLHWPDAPGQTAEETRDFWAGSDNKAGDSAHCAISENGVIIQTLPWFEKGFHVGSAQVDPVSGRIYTDLARDLFGDYAKQPQRISPNRCTIGIEMETVDDLGTYTPETVAAAIELCAYLCGQYHLEPSTRIVTHNQIVGWKDCPRWMVNHPEDLEAFKAAVAEKMADPS